MEFSLMSLTSFFKIQVDLEVMLDVAYEGGAEVGFISLPIPLSINPERGQDELQCDTKNSPALVQTNPF